jgi:hypothetical protein
VLGILRGGERVDPKMFKISNQLRQVMDLRGSELRLRSEAKMKDGSNTHPLLNSKRAEFL